jgi:peptidoglycan hydrolase CwlO-like protein
MATVEDVTLLLASYLIEQNRDLLSGLSDQITQQLGELMSNQDELNTRVEYLGTQVQEVVTEVQNLKDQVAGMDVDFSALDAAIQPLADIVPDAAPPVDDPDV